MDVNTERIMSEIRNQIAKEREQTVDIEAIMREIRAQIAAEGIKEQIPAFSSVAIDHPADCPQGGIDGWEQFMQSLRYVNESYEIPYYWELGPANLKTFIKRIIRKLLKFLLAPIVARQNEFNAYTVRCLNTMRYFMEEQRRENQRVKEQLEQMYSQLQSKDQAMELAQEKLISELQQITVAHEQFNAEMRTIKEAQKQLSAEFQEMQQAKAQEENPYQELDYFHFQNKFRGSRELIKARQEMYVPYFENQRECVLDIGCGRGEFLELMKENGIAAVGVDLYSEYVTDGNASGLDVRQGDGIEYLEQSDQKFGGIFVGQVIEHISFDQLINLCRLAYQKLDHGACLVMETPNPMSLSTFTSSFYIDPTHNKPIHPLTLEYILREVGFTDVQTVYTACSRPEQLPPIEGHGIENLEKINAAISRVSDMLYGSQDYAVIARR